LTGVCGFDFVITSDPGSSEAYSISPQAGRDTRAAMSARRITWKLAVTKRLRSMKLSKRTSEQLATGVKRFQPVIASAKARDVNESDTAIIVTDILADCFGYDKYSEITSEFSIRGTYCDLAIKLENKPRLLIEVKPVGGELKEAHTKQAVDYAANQGIEWVLLTNAVAWRVYRVQFTQPINQELVLEFDFTTLEARKTDHLELIGLLTKEGLTKSGLDDYHEQRQAMSRYFLGAMMLSDSVLEVVRRELRRVSPGVKIEVEEIRSVLEQEVIKRDVLEGDRAAEAKRKVSRCQNRPLRAAKKADEPETPVPVEPAAVVSATPIVAVTPSAVQP
jgi:hypothetical protein